MVKCRYHSNELFNRVSTWNYLLTPYGLFFLVLIAYRKHPMYTCKLVLEHIAWTQDALLGPWSTYVADARGQYGLKKKRDVRWGLFFLAPTLLVFQTPSTQVSGQSSIFTWNKLNANEQNLLFSLINIRFIWSSTFDMALVIQLN